MQRGIYSPLILAWGRGRADINSLALWTPCMQAEWAMVARESWVVAVEVGLACTEMVHDEGIQIGPQQCLLHDLSCT